MSKFRLLGALLLIGCGVTEPAPAPVTVTFCANQVVGGRIAIRDDAGAFGIPGQWSLVDAADGKTFSFAAPGRLTLALTEGETSNTSNLRVFQLTSDELPKLNCLANATGATRVYSGTIAGLGTGRSALVGLGTGLVTRGNGSFTMQNFATGAADLVALMRSGPTVEKFIVRRDLDLQTGTVISPIDFSGLEGVAPRINTATVSGAALAPVGTFYRLVTKGTTVGIPVPLANGIMTLASLPAEVQAPGDFYVLGASIVIAGARPDARTVNIRFSTPDDRLLTLGPALEAPSMTFSLATVPASLRIALPVQSQYAERADVSVSQATEGIFLRVTMTMTRAYRGSSSTWNFETPAPGALPARSIKLDPNAFTSWTAYASSGDFLSLFLGSSPSDLTIREAYTDGAVGAGPLYHSRITNSYPERLCFLCSRTLPF